MVFQSGFRVFVVVCLGREGFERGLVLNSMLRL